MLTDSVCLLCVYLYLYNEIKKIKIISTITISNRKREKKHYVYLIIILLIMMMIIIIIITIIIIIINVGLDVCNVEKLSIYQMSMLECLCFINESIYFVSSSTSMTKITIFSLFFFFCFNFIYLFSVHSQLFSTIECPDWSSNNSH